MKLGFLKKLSFQKVFQKVKCLVKTVKKCFLKKLSVWLALIKVTVLGINYQKKNNVYIREFISYLNKYCKIIFWSPILANNNLPLKIYCESIVIIYTDFNLNVLLKLFFSHQY